MEPGARNRFGRVDLEVTAFGFGTAPVGNIFREIDERTSDAMFRTAWDAGVRYYDTAPMYGHGLSELRTGHSLRWKDRMDKVAKIEAVCARPGVPLPAAAMQFVLAHPAVPSFIAGTRTVEQLEKNLAWFGHPIPGELWADLVALGLLREDAPVPQDRS